MQSLLVYEYIDAIMQEGKFCNWFLTTFSEPLDSKVWTVGGHVLNTVVY